MMKKLFSLALGFLFLNSLTACNGVNRDGVEAQVINRDEPASIQEANNLLALFLVKKDNLKNELHGEIYPIALYINDAYVDVSNDVTPQIQINFKEENLLKLMQQKSFLSAIKNFNVIKDNTKIGDFTINKLGIGQFACSSLLIGQGTFQGQQSLQTIFDSIPANRSGGFSGSIGDKNFDQTWRWSLAINQHNPSPNAKPTPTAEEEARYKQDLLTEAQSFIAQFLQSPELKDKQIVGEEVIEEMSVIDLNGDGQPEVFGRIRKGVDPRSQAALQQNQQNATVYASVWLTYQSNQPAVISSAVQYYTLHGEFPYTLIGTLDINGDGIQEVIVQNNGYESTSFGIYEYKNNVLRRVFNGAGYGC